MNFNEGTSTPPRGHNTKPNPNNSLTSHPYSALADPMLKHFENTWASAFRKWLPSRLDTFAEDMREALGRFRLEMARAGRPLPHAASLNSLAERQMRNLQASMEDVNDLKATLGTGQRGANRLLVPVVARRMREAYARCVEEKGKLSPRASKPHARILTPPRAWAASNA